MKEFIDAKEVKLKKEKVNYLTVENFITKFNRAINIGKEEGDGSSHLNSGLENIPILNDAEFDIVVGKAHLKGWKLTRSDDNYQTTTYKMEKI